MEANFTKAMPVLDSLIAFFNPQTDNPISTLTLDNAETDNDASAGTPSEHEREEGVDDTEKAKKDLKAKKSGVQDSISSDDLCFGFENLGVTPVKKAGKDDVSSGDKRTPERIGHSTELTDEMSEKLKKVTLPQCSYFKEKKNILCTEPIEHKLCLMTSVSIADFMVQAGKRDEVSNLLKEICFNFDERLENPLLNMNVYLIKNEKSKLKIVQNLEKEKDSDLVSAYLTVSCITAEVGLHQRNFKAVDDAWSVGKELKDLNLFQNVLHETILMSRLALCQASSILLSSLMTEQSEKSNIDLAVEQSCTKLEGLSLTARKMNIETNTATSDETKTEKKKVARSLLTDSVKATPLKSKPKMDVMATPRLKMFSGVFASAKKPVASAKKTKAINIAQTPATRMRDLATLIASDDEEDVVFPEKKPVTPSVTNSVRKISRSVKSKTNPRNVNMNPRKNSLEKTPANVACKLDFIFEDDKSSSGIKDAKITKRTSDETSLARKTSKSKFFRTKEEVNDVGSEQNDFEINEDELSSQKDVFDFGGEFSPAVKSANSTRSSKGGKKGSKTVKNASRTNKTSAKAGEPDNDTSVDDKSRYSKGGGRKGKEKENKDDSTAADVEDVEDVKEEIKPKRRGRRKKAEDVESVRHLFDCLETNIDIEAELEPCVSDTDHDSSESDCEVQVDLDISLRVQSDSGLDDIEIVRSDRKCEQVLDLELSDVNEDDNEIEVFRSDGRPKGRTTRGRKARANVEVEEGEDDDSKTEHTGLDSGGKVKKAAAKRKTKSGDKLRKQAENIEISKDKVEKVKTKKSVEKIGNVGINESKEWEDVKCAKEDVEMSEENVEPGDVSCLERMRSGRLCSVQEMADRLAFQEDPVVIGDGRGDRDQRLEGENVHNISWIA